MDTRDVVGTPSESATLSTCREAISKLTESEFWQSLNERMNVVIQSFSASDPADKTNATHGTNLNQPLADAPRQFKNLRAVVLASDGDWNEGDPPVQAATEVADHALQIGKAAQHRDAPDRLTLIRRRL